MTTKQQCPVQGWTWKSVPELSTNPRLPNQFFPLHNHCVSALYTISIVTCPAAPLTTKIIYCSQCVSTFWDVSMFSLLKTVTIDNSAFFRQNQDTCIQCLSPFLNSPWKIKGGVSSARWQLGAKLLLESTLSLAPEHKLCSGTSSSPAALRGQQPQSDSLETIWFADDVTEWLHVYGELLETMCLFRNLTSDRHHKSSSFETSTYFVVQLEIRFKILNYCSFSKRSSPPWSHWQIENKDCLKVQFLVL